MPAGYPIGKGADLFISVWNLHRSPYLWKEPDVFRPERYQETFTNADFGGKWAGGPHQAAPLTCHGQQYSAEVKAALVASVSPLCVVVAVANRGQFNLLFSVVYICPAKRQC